MIIKATRCCCVLLWLVTQSCLTLFSPMVCRPPGSSVPMDPGVGCHALLQGIFPTQGSNLRLLCLLPWQVGSLPTEPWEAHKLSCVHGNPGVGLVDQREVTTLSLPSRSVQSSHGKSDPCQCLRTGTHSRVQSTLGSPAMCWECRHLRMTKPGFLNGSAG